MWFIGLRSAVKPREEWNVTLDDHLSWMKRQHEAGKIVMSGPTPDRKLGIYLIRADSREEAEGIAGSDPYTAAGFCTFELIEWELHQVMERGRSPWRRSRRRDGRTAPTCLSDPASPRLDSRFRGNDGGKRE